MQAALRPAAEQSQVWLASFLGQPSVNVASHTHPELSRDIVACVNGPTVDTHRAAMLMKLSVTLVQLVFTLHLSVNADVHFTFVRDVSFTPVSNVGDSWSLYTCQ